MEKKPGFTGLKFQPIPVRDDIGTVEHYVIRASLPAEVTEPQANAIATELNKDFHEAAERHAGRATPSMNTVNAVQSDGGYALECTRTVASNQYNDASVAANMLTLLCERKPTIMVSELIHRLRGGTKGDIERN